MLVIERKENESIDRMVKRYKRKRRDTQLKKELRERKHYTKPSEERRNEILNARYRLENYGN